MSKHEAQNSKTRRELYSQYVKTHNLESLISEMTNSVVHALSPNPIIYMIKYLTGLLSEEDRTANEISIPPPYPQGVPIVHFPKYKSSNLLSKYLTKENWPTFKYSKTKYNNNINVLTKLNENNPDDPIGLALVDGDCINKFNAIVNDIICEVHGLTYNKDQEYFKTGNFTTLNKEDVSFIANNEKKISSISFEFCRNIDGFSFNNSIRNNSKVKEDIVKAVNEMMSDGIIDTKLNMYTQEEEYKPILDELFSEEMKFMKDSGIDEFDKDNGDEENNITPVSNRVVFADENKLIVILVNFANHFTLLVSSKPNECNIVDTYNKGVSILKSFSLNFQLETDKQYGYIASEIPILGACMKIYSSFNLTHLSSYNDIINNSKFSSYSISDNTLKLKQNYSLSEGDELSFVSHFLCKINGLINLDSSSRSLSFDKISFNPNCKDTPEEKAYLDSYEQMKYTLSSNGYNINSLMSYYNSVNSKEENMFLNEMSDYYSFYHFIAKYIKESQGFNIEKLNHINKPEKPRDIVDITSEELTHIKGINICVFRNIKSYPFALSPNNKNQEIEELIKNTINSMNAKGHYANYFSLTDPMTKTQAEEIIAKNNMRLYHNDKMQKSGLDPDFPNHRGLIQFQKDNIYAIINDIDHIKFYYCSSEIKEGCNIGKEFVNLIKVMNEFIKYIKFEYDNKFGFFTSCPRYVGTGMKIKVDLSLPNVNKEDMDLWILEKGYKWNKKGDLIELENVKTIGLTETEMLCNLLFYLKDVIEMNETK